MRREKFLGEMERAVPRARLEPLIKPQYPTIGRMRPQSIGVPRMLRMYFLPQWFGLANEAVEDAIYDQPGDAQLCGHRPVAQDGARRDHIVEVRRLLEKHVLTAQLFEGINAHQRDPEMRQTKKGNEWHFGIKAHIGVSMPM